MAKAAARQVNTQFDRIAATCAALVIVGLVVFLLIRNEQIADPGLFFALRLVLSFGTAVLGATIPGFLAIGWSGSGLTIRAGGALALFVLTYLYTPNLAMKQSQGGQVTINAPGGVVAGQITNSPINIGLSPEELRRTVKDLSRDNRVSSEARVQAEIRAAQRIKALRQQIGTVVCRDDDREPYGHGDGLALHSWFPPLKKGG